MVFTIYSIACVVFIVLGLAMLWPINAAFRRVKNQTDQLQHEASTVTSGTADRGEQR